MTKKKFKVFLLDDEENALDNLSFKIGKYCPELEIIGSAKNLIDAAKSIKSLEPDILFFDLVIGNYTSFELFEILDLKFKPIVFVSAHEEYSKEALGHSDIELLMKPIVPEELIIAKDKAIDQWNNNRSNEKLIELHKKGKLNIDVSTKVSQLMFPTVNGYVFHMPNEITFFKASGNYSEMFLTNNRKVLTSYPLGEIEKMLEGQAFLRVHKSYYINVEHVKEYKNGSPNTITFSDGSIALVSTRRKKDFLGFFKKRS